MMPDLSRQSESPHLAKPKRKLTPAERRVRRERKAKFTTIFINGKQKRVPRPQLIDGLTVDEFIARNADTTWLHENGLWELMIPDEECFAMTERSVVPTGFFNSTSPR